MEKWNLTFFKPFSGYNGSFSFHCNDIWNVLKNEKYTKLQQQHFHDWALIKLYVCKNRTMSLNVT